MRLTGRFDTIIAIDKDGTEHHVKGIRFKEGCIRFGEEKLFALENIEEELGIDLITLFKAQTNGIWYLDFNGYNENGKSTHISRKQEHDIYIDFKQKALVGKWISYDFKDYGKTWALTKEELK